MPRVQFRYRLIADEYFIRWIIKNNKPIFLKLTHIKSSSIDCKKEHNIMIEEDGLKIISEGLIQESNLRAAFKGQNIPIQVTKVINDKHDQLILLAMILATDKPYFTYLLTTKDHLLKYQSSTHNTNVKSISIKAEEDALKIIDVLWNEFCLVREIK